MNSVVLLFGLFIGSFQPQQIFSASAAASAKSSSLQSTAATFLQPYTERPHYLLQTRQHGFDSVTLVPTLDISDSIYQHGGRPGLNFGLAGSSGGTAACYTCSSADYSYAQRCCSFGHSRCCNIYQQNYSPQYFGSGDGLGSNGYSGRPSWRPSTGGVYDYQYNSQFGNDLNSGEKPGSCYRLSTGNQNWYNDHRTAPYQSYGAPQTSYGTSVTSGGYGGYNYNNVATNSATRYCRTDYECTGVHKCCSGICSNPYSFYG